MLRQQSKVTNQKVRDLENFVDELDDRLRDHEAHTRKDSVRFVNPPFDASKNETLAEKIVNVFEKCLDIKCITKTGLVAHHVVPSRKPLPARNMSTVIIKFVQFHKKELVMKNRRFKRSKKPLNEKIYTSMSLLVL